MKTATKERTINLFATPPPLRGPPPLKGRTKQLFVVPPSGIPPDSRALRHPLKGRTKQLFVVPPSGIPPGSRALKHSLKGRTKQLFVVLPSGIPPDSRALRHPPQREDKTALRDATIGESTGLPCFGDAPSLKGLIHCVHVAGQDINRLRCFGEGDYTGFRRCTVHLSRRLLVHFQHPVLHRQPSGN